MIGRVWRLLRDLSGRNDARFVELLCAQLDQGVAVVRRIRRSVEQREDFATLSDDVGRLAGEADAYRDALIEELGVALTTPLDREDLFRLSRSLDDIVDNLHDFVDALVRFDVGRSDAPGHALRVIDEGLVQLRHAVETLAADPTQVPAAARSAKQATPTRRAYLDGLEEVFEAGDCVTMLKLRELLRRLDVVGLRFGEAADVLADAALKRS